MRCGLLMAALLAGCLESPPASGPSGGDAAPADAGPPLACACPVEPCPFRYAREIHTVPSLIPQDLSQVPVLIRVETSEHMAADGSDLRFATPAGDLLPHEVELFPPPGGTAAIWVGVPSIVAGADSTFCLFYGAEAPGAAADPGGVWDTGFAGVWHLGETSTGAPGEFRDSTSRSCNGTGGDAISETTLPVRVEARIGFGQEFDGDALIDVGTGSHLDLDGTAITLEAWVLVPALRPDFLTLVGKEGFTSGYRLLIGPDGEVLFQLTDAERHAETGVGVAAPGSWHYIAATYDGAAMRIYVDARKLRDKAEIGAIDSNEVPLQLGISNGEYPLFGTLDEVRVSTVARTTEWLSVQRAAALGDLVIVGDERGL